MSLAAYYVEKNNFSQAEKILERVKDKGSDLIHYQILDLYGQVLSRQNKLDEAIAVYPRIVDFLRQDLYEYTEYSQTLELLKSIAGKGVTGNSQV